MNFTSNQRSAIEYISGNLQLIARAGLGKTKVVVQWVVSLLISLTILGLFGVWKYRRCLGQSELEAVLR